jgi:hypothetical protein
VQGAAVGSATGGFVAPSTFQASAEQARKKGLIIAATVLALIVAGAVGIKASGILESGKSPAKAGLVTAKGQDAGSIIKAKGDDQNPMLKQGAALISMPDDVRDWLEHLRKVEEKKRQLTADQMHEMTILMGQMQGSEGLMTGQGVRDMADPDSNITQAPAVNTFKDFIDKSKAQWYALSEFLRSKPAPAECKPIESSYDQGLNQMGMTMSDFTGIIDDVTNKADSDPEGAKRSGTDSVNNIGATHTKNIDQSFGEADKGVADICAKYHTSKMFDIDTNGKSSSPFISKG